MILQYQGEKLRGVKGQVSQHKIDAVVSIWPPENPNKIMRFKTIHEALSRKGIVNRKYTFQTVRLLNQLGEGTKEKGKIKTKGLNVVKKIGRGTYQLNVVPDEFRVFDYLRCLRQKGDVVKYEIGGFTWKMCELYFLGMPETVFTYRDVDYAMQILGIRISELFRAFQVLAAEIKAEKERKKKANEQDTDFALIVTGPEHLIDSHGSQKRSIKDDIVQHKDEDRSPLYLAHFLLDYPREDVLDVFRIYGAKYLGSERCNETLDAYEKLHAADYLGHVITEAEDLVEPLSAKEQSEIAAGIEKITHDFGLKTLITYLPFSHCAMSFVKPTPQKEKSIEKFFPQIPAGKIREWLTEGSALASEVFEHSYEKGREKFEAYKSATRHEDRLLGLHPMVVRQLLLELIPYHLGSKAGLDFDGLTSEELNKVLPEIIGVLPERIVDAKGWSASTSKNTLLEDFGFINMLVKKELTLEENEE